MTVRRRSQAQKFKRIYRGAATAPDDTQCPECGKRVTATSRGMRRSHKDQHGRPCPGSGMRMHEIHRDVQLDALPPVVMPYDRTRRDWAAKREPAPYRPTPESCPECGRRMSRNASGELRRHRVTADDPLAAWCVQSAPGRPRY